MSTQTEARISALPLYGRVVLVVVTEEDGEAVTRSHVLPVEAARYLALGNYLMAQLEKAAVNPDCVLILEGGLTLECLSDEQLARVGLARIADA
jgi:hypothetical protein